MKIDVVACGSETERNLERVVYIAIYSDKPVIVIGLPLFSGKLEFSQEYICDLDIGTGRKEVAAIACEQISRVGTDFTSSRLSETVTDDEVIGVSDVVPVRTEYMLVCVLLGGCNGLLSIW